MSADLANCPRCGAAIKVSAIGFGNELLSSARVNAFNVALDESSTHACQKCMAGQYGHAAAKLDVKSHKLQNDLTNSLTAIPLVSIGRPHGWSYKSLGLVTAQSTTGTGLVSELTTAWTDLFGLQSKRYNSKIRDGENLCKGSLRLQALALGGNAIAGVDVDYAEVGGQRAMLMVCMTGTAIILDNAESHVPGLDETCKKINAITAALTAVDAARSELAG